MATYCLQSLWSHGVLKGYECARVVTISAPPHLGDIDESLCCGDIDKVALIVMQFDRLQAHMHKFVQ